MGAALGALSIGGSVLGTFMDVQGTRMESRAAQNLAGYQAQIARNNQAIALQRARDAEERGRVVEGRIRSVTEQNIGSSRANAAARGVEVDTGSSADIQSTIGAVGEIDALTARENAVREAQGFEDISREFGQEAVLRGYEGDMARVAGKFNTARSIISGATSVASKWYRP